MSSHSMRVTELTGAFGVDNLREIERPIPEPGPGQVLLRIRAVSLNYRDLLMIDGAYNPRQPLPLVPLSDAVAEVIARGDGVQWPAVGARVCPIFAESWLAGPPTREQLATTLGGPRPGVLADYRLAPASALIQPPAHLSDVEAATLPCAAVTAWSALVEHGRLRPGDKVLVQGTGGVSIFALQLARLAGAEVMITSSDPGKLERARQLGAAHGHDYRAQPEWGKAARAWSGGAGVDHVIEVGGAGTLDQSLRAVRPGGAVAIIGVLSGAQHPINITPILMQQIRLQGVIVGSKASFEAMNQAIAAHQLRPVVDRVFERGALREAIAHMRAGRHFGKLALTLT